LFAFCLLFCLSFAQKDESCRPFRLLLNWIWIEKRKTGLRYHTNSTFLLLELVLCMIRILATSRRSHRFPTFRNMNFPDDFVTSSRSICSHIQSVCCSKHTYELQPDHCLLLPTAEANRPPATFVKRSDADSPICLLLNGSHERSLPDRRRWVAQTIICYRTANANGLTGWL
jgi:hypothetical protein